MASEWVDVTECPDRYLFTDAMGTPLDGVEAVRVTDEGIEVIAIAVTPEGSELVCSLDGGITLEPIRARMNIPGGMLVDISTDED